MITSLDGRLLAERWPCSEETLLEIYDATGDRLEADGWIVGRKTMEHYLPASEPMLAPAARPRQDRINVHGDRPLGICFDRQGRLRPETGEIEGSHLVLVVAEQVLESHVADLAARGVSVVFAGPDGNDVSSALTRIAGAFGVKRLLLEGGGILDGAFLAAGLIDETSTLLYPVVDGQKGIPAIYDHEAETKVRSLELISAETLDDGTVWLRHRVARN